MRFKDKVTIVTGAAAGIGKGIAEVFSEEGSKVVIVDWNDEIGNQTTKEISQKGGDAIFVKCDVAAEQDVKNAVEKTLAKYGRISNSRPRL